MSLKCVLLWLLNRERLKQFKNNDFNICNNYFNHKYKKNLFESKSNIIRIFFYKIFSNDFFCFKYYRKGNNEKLTKTYIIMFYNVSNKKML